MVCEEDEQCQIGYFCWYKTADDAKNNVKRCMEMFTADIYDEFGWAFTSSDKSKVYSLADYT